MHKAGRYTAALTLIIVGGALLSDKVLHTEWLSDLVRWWPLVLIGLGFEYLLFSLVIRGGDRLRLDVGSVVFSVIVSGLVIVFGQGSINGDWSSFFKGLNIQSWTSSAQEFGAHKFDEGVTKVPFAPGTKKIVLDDPNGQVTVQSADVNQIEIGVTVYVDQLGEAEAKTIADQSKIEFSEGETLTINAKGYLYGSDGKRKPRMNLIVTVPKKQDVDMEITMINGSFTGNRLPIANALSVQTSNGGVNIGDIDGNVKVQTTNGSLEVSNIKGDVWLKTSNGRVEADTISGAAELYSTNGRADGKNIGGNVTISTTNGEVSVEEAPKELHAHTTNGRIRASSSVVGGNWKLDTSNGSIEVKLPETGDFSVHGKSRGSIDTELPLQKDNRTVTGTIGAGTYSIELETSGSISIEKNG